MNYFYSSGDIILSCHSSILSCHSSSSHAFLSECNKYLDLIFRRVVYNFDKNYYSIQTTFRDYHYDNICSINEKSFDLRTNEPIDICPETEESILEKFNILKIFK